MATLRKDGRWMARRRTAKGIIYHYSPVSPEDAEAGLDHLIAELDTVSTARLTTLHDVAKMIWYPRIQNLKPLTVKKYEGVYVNWLRSTLGKLAPASITSSDIQTIVNKATKAGMSAKQAIFIRDIAGQILKCAQEHGLAQSNVAQWVKTPKEPDKRIRVVTVDEAIGIMDHVKGTVMDCPVFLALVLGLRRGEVAGLKWDDLDRQKGELTISRQRQAIRPHGVQETQVKAGSKRVLRLTPKLIEELDSRGDLDSPYISTYNGKPWVPDTITDNWRALKPKGMKDWTFHDLRHGAAGLIYAMTNDVLVVMTILGHKKPDMSLLYIAQNSERCDRAFPQMEAMFK